MSEEEIYNLLDKMLLENKSKNFLNHLIYSYIPVYKVERIWERPTGNFKCALTGDELIAIDEIMKGINSEEFKDEFMIKLKKDLIGDKDSTNPILKLVGDKKVGVTGKNTTTFMSQPSFNVFHKWVIDKTLTGNKHINWLIKSLIKDDEKPKKPIIKNDNFKNKKASFNIGESNEVLLKIKEKLDRDAE